MLKRLLGILTVFIMVVQAEIAIAGDPGDAAGIKGPPIFNRMPGFHIRQGE